MKKLLIFLLLLLPACGRGDPAVEYRVKYPGISPADYTQSTEAYDPPPRFYKETALQLIPSEDYGPIYPYLGYYGNWFSEGAVYADDAGNRWVDPPRLLYDQTLFGFCTADGVILSEPYYSSVSLREHDGKELYVLTVPGKSQTLTTPDGSLVADYDQLHFYNKTAFDYNNGLHFDAAALTETPYITVSREGKWGLVDYEGQEILPVVYQNPLHFTGKYAPVLNGDGTYSYIDLQGNTVLGPYSAPEEDMISLDISQGSPTAWAVEAFAFYNGRAVMHHDGKYGMMDENGSIIAPARYDFVSPWHGGSAKVTDETGTYWTDFAGNTLPAEDYWQVGPGVFRSADGWVDLRGQPLDRSLRDYQYLGYGCALWRYSDRIEIRQEGEVLLSLPGNQPEDRIPYMYYGDGRFVTTEGIMDPEGNITSWQDQDTGWGYPSFGIRVRDGYMAVSDGKWGGLIDPDGSWVVRLPMIDRFTD